MYMICQAQLIKITLTMYAQNCSCEAKVPCRPLQTGACKSALSMRPPFAMGVMLPMCGRASPPWPELQLPVFCPSRNRYSSQSCDGANAVTWNDESVVLRDFPRYRVKVKAPTQAWMCYEAKENKNLALSLTLVPLHNIQWSHS